jgi:hypothetical protein
MKFARQPDDRQMARHLHKRIISKSLGNPKNCASEDKTMQNRQVVPVLVVLTALGTVFSLASSVRAEGDLSAFMKVKLKHSERVLEGLATEDYELIVKNAQAISLLCEDEMWSVLQTPEYRERSLEFRRSVNAITEAARSKNLEAATLSYVDVTMKCVSCHKYVRKSRATVASRTTSPIVCARLSAAVAQRAFLRPPLW